MGVKKKDKSMKLLSEKKLRLKYPASGLASTICLDEQDVLWLPSRILPFNKQLGGGIPYGHILELYGEENVGKTLMAMDFAYVCQALGGMVLWADAESTFNGPWAMKNGLDLSRIELLPIENATEVISDWIFDMVKFHRSKLTHNEPILLVIDSLAAMECLANINASQVDSKAEMGNRAKALDTMLRRRNHLFHTYGICCIFINQLRSKIGASQFEDPDTTPGGKAMRFYASLRVGLYRGALIKDKKSGKKVGRVVYCRLHKTKVAMPNENIKCEVYFQEYKGRLGYSKYFGFSEVLVEAGVLKDKKKRFYFEDKLVAHGEEAMDKAIAEDAELRKALIKKSRVMTVSAAEKRIKKATNNLYAVTTKKSDEEEEE